MLFIRNFTTALSCTNRLRSSCICASAEVSSKDIILRIHWLVASVLVTFLSPTGVSQIALHTESGRCQQRSFQVYFPCCMQFVEHPVGMRPLLGKRSFKVSVMVVL